MTRTTRILIVALAVAAFSAAQTDCEDTCMPKLIAAVKCSTYDCACFAFDEPEYVACLQAECGRGYDSVRAAEVMGCEIYGVTLSPNPPGMATATTAPGILQPTASSKLTVTGQAATPTSPAQAGPSTTSGSGNGNENGNGSGSGSSSSGDTTRTGSGSDSSNGTSKSGLSTGELIGIIIGGISAVATIVGVWVAVKRKKDRKGSVSTPSSGYYQQIGVQQVVLPTNNFPRPFPPVNPNMYQPPYPNAQPMPMHYPQGPPPKYEQRQK